MLAGVEWYLIVVLILISLMINEFSIFHVLIGHLCKMSVQITLPFFIGLLAFIIELFGSFYAIDISPLLHI